MTREESEKSEDIEMSNFFGCAGILSAVSLNFELVSEFRIFLVAILQQFDCLHRSYQG